MSEEDERTLWCGNLSDKVTDELLYELCLQAGPVQSVTIPRDSDKKQRSFAFVTYVHACSVEYAIRIFEGSALFKRQLTLHKKIRNGPNPSASPKENFKYPSPNGRLQNEIQETNNAFMLNSPVARHQDASDQDGVMFNVTFNNMQAAAAPIGMPNEMSALAMGMALGMNGLNPDMLMQLGHQMFGAELPTTSSFDDNNHQNNTYRNKMNRHDRHQRNPYSRDDRYDRNHRNRNDNRHQKRHEGDNRKTDRDRDYRRR